VPPRGARRRQSWAKEVAVAEARVEAEAARREEAEPGGPRAAAEAAGVARAAALSTRPAPRETRLVAGEATLRPRSSRRRRSRKGARACGPSAPHPHGREARAMESTLAATNASGLSPPGCPRRGRSPALVVDVERPHQGRPYARPRGPTTLPLPGWPRGFGRTTRREEDRPKGEAGWEEKAGADPEAGWPLRIVIGRCRRLTARALPFPSGFPSPNCAKVEQVVCRRVRRTALRGENSDRA
jgi:hypothetical protein